MAESGLEEMINRKNNGKEVNKCPRCGHPVKKVETKFNTQFICTADVSTCKTILYGVKSDIAKQM